MYAGWDAALSIVLAHTLRKFLATCLSWYPETALEASLLLPALRGLRGVASILLAPPYLGHGAIVQMSVFASTVF